MYDRKFFCKKHKMLHPWSKQILLHIITRMNWRPLKSEFNIYDEGLRIGTSIDMICLNKDGKLVFLEFKTGYKDYFTSHDGFMSHSLHFMRSSPLNWAVIQLIFSVLMVIRNFPQINLEDTESYVIRIDDENLQSFPIKNEFIQVMGKFLFTDVYSITTTLPLAPKNNNNNKIPGNKDNNSNSNHQNEYMNKKKRIREDDVLHDYIRNDNCMVLEKDLNLTYGWKKQTT